MSLRALPRDVVLSYDVVGAPDAARTALFLHGIFGSKNNWRGFARRCTDRFPQWRCVVVDLRCHGESHGFPPPNDLAHCATDLHALCAHAQLEPDVVVGHSFGGKVALTFAAAPPPSLREAWILDAPPGARPLLDAGAPDTGGREEIARVIEAIEAMPLPIVGRRELVDAMVARGLAPAIAAWMTTNLRATDGGFAWRFDLDGCRELLASFARTDAWPVVEGESAIAFHVVRGGRSDRWLDDDRARLAADAEDGCLTDDVIADAGHWLHTDDPDALLALMSPSLAAS